MMLSGMKFPEAQMYHSRSTPEELAEIAVSKIVSISPNVDPMVQAQAHAFRQQVKGIVYKMIIVAEQNKCQQIRMKLRDQGYDLLADNVVR